MRLVPNGERLGRSIAAVRRRWARHFERVEEVMFTFTVPGKPVPKARARVTSRGTYTPASTRRYERAVKACALYARPKGWDATTAYHVTTHVYFPDARRRDADNVQKAIWDACNGVLWGDDSQIVSWGGTKRIDRENPRVVVVVDAWQA